MRLSLGAAPASLLPRASPLFSVSSSLIISLSLPPARPIRAARSGFTADVRRARPAGGVLSISLLDETEVDDAIEAAKEEIAGALNEEVAAWAAPAGDAGAAATPTPASPASEAAAAEAPIPAMTRSTTAIALICGGATIVAEGAPGSAPWRAS